MKKYSFFMKVGTTTAISCLCLALGIGFFMEFYVGKVPCPLCFLQRLSMFGIAISLYFNMAFKPQVKHFGFALIWSVLGLSAALRHVALNICKPLSTEGVFFGSYRLYTWSFLIFFFSILGIGALLCFYKENLEIEKKGSLSLLANSIGSLLCVLILIGLFSVLKQEGLSF